MILTFILSFLIGISSTEIDQSEIEMLEIGNEQYIAITPNNMIHIQNLEMAKFSLLMETAGYREYLVEEGVLSYIKGEFPIKFQTITKDINYDVTSFVWRDTVDEFQMGDKIILELKDSLQNTSNGYNTYLITMGGIEYKFKLSDTSGALNEFMIGFPN